MYSNISDNRLLLGLEPNKMFPANCSSSMTITAIDAESDAARTGGHTSATTVMVARQEVKTTAINVMSRLPSLVACALPYQAELSPHSNQGGNTGSPAVVGSSILRVAPPTLSMLPAAVSIPFCQFPLALSLILSSAALRGS